MMGGLGKWGKKKEPVHGRGSGFGMISHASREGWLWERMALPNGRGGMVERTG